MLRSKNESKFIRGSTEGVNNVFWTRRYVKWYGYSIYVLNEDSKEMIGSINIADAQPGCEQLNKGILSFKTSISNVEIHCDSMEKLKGISTALSILFPKMVSWV